MPNHIEQLISRLMAKCEEMGEAGGRCDDLVAQAEKIRAELLQAIANPTKEKLGSFQVAREAVTHAVNLGAVEVIVFVRFPPEGPLAVENIAHATNGKTVPVLGLLEVGYHRLGRLRSV